MNLLEEAEFQRDLSKSLPEILKQILLKRRDLISLGFHKLEQERLFVCWLIKHGKTEYPDIFQGNSNNNNFLKWLSEKPINGNLPRIILAIWDIHKMHKNRWPNPHENNSYFRWLQREWNNLSISLPPYYSIFTLKTSDVWYFGILDWLEFVFWILKKIFIINVKVKKDLINSNYYLKGWIIQKNVIDALIYRELKTRISTVKGGILGVFIEPLGVMSVFLILFSLLRGNSRSIDILLFLGSGIVLFTLFNDIAIRSANAMIANEALFFYRPVKPIDTVIARTIVESGLYSFVFLVIILGTFLIREKWILDNFLLLIASYLGLVVFSFGVGLILMVATYVYPSLLQFIPLAMRPIWFISGVFVSLQSIPQGLRPYLSWNPIFQSIELARHSFTSSYIIDNNEVSLLYLWYCSMITIAIGLWVYSNNERKLLTR